MSSVLVVDDNPVDRRLIGGLLRKSTDLKVEYATNGEEALQKVREETPSLVITDLVMPKMDGLKLVGTLVREFPSVPVILLTGKGSEEIAVQALEAGAASYVPKKVMSALLADTVSGVLTAAWEQQQQHRLMQFIEESETRFEIANDAAMIPPLIQYVHQGIRNVGLCDESNGIRVSVALEEALNNALFHGNLELSSDMREGNRAEYRRLIEIRRSAEPYCRRRIRIRVHLTRERGLFIIEDEGPGFDPKRLPDPTDPENLEKASGRGVLLMKTFMDDVTYNDRGNQVHMVKLAQPKSKIEAAQEATP